MLSSISFVTCFTLKCSKAIRNSGLVTNSAIRGGKDCSLLLSVTDPELPPQPGSDARYWFPPKRQLKQPQMDVVSRAICSSAQESASFLSLPKSADLEALLAENSFDDLKKLCEKLKITPIGNRNMLQTAESILFHECALKSCQSAKPSIRHQPERRGKVLSLIVCHGVTVLTSVIPHR